MSGLFYFSCELRRCLIGALLSIPLAAAASAPQETFLPPQSIPLPGTMTFGKFVVADVNGDHYDDIVAIGTDIVDSTPQIVVDVYLNEGKPRTATEDVVFLKQRLLLKAHANSDAAHRQDQVQPRLRSAGWSIWTTTASPTFWRAMPQQARSSCCGTRAPMRRRRSCLSGHSDPTCAVHDVLQSAGHARRIGSGFGHADLSWRRPIWRWFRPQIDRCVSRCLATGSVQHGEGAVQPAQLRIAGDLLSHRQRAASTSSSSAQRGPDAIFFRRAVRRLERRDGLERRSTIFASDENVAAI